MSHLGKITFNYFFFQKAMADLVSIQNKLDSGYNIVDSIGCNSIRTLLHSGTLVHVMENGALKEVTLFLVCNDNYAQCRITTSLLLAHVRECSFNIWQNSKILPGGHSHWRQYAYARTARVPFWPISVPQRVGFSSNVPLRVGFWTPNVCQKGYHFSTIVVP